MAEKEADRSSATTNVCCKPSEESSDEPRVTVWVVLAVIITILGSGLPSGYCIGVLNTPQEIIRAWIKSSVERHSEHTLTLSEELYIWAVIVSTFVIGAIIGSPFGGIMADKLGRRMGLFVNHLLFLFAAGIITSCKVADTIYLLVFGRFISGICAGFSCSLMPVYLSEVAPPVHRGVMGVMLPSALCLGLMISQIFGLEDILGTKECWPYLVGGFGVPVLIALLLQPALPDSPAYCFTVLKNELRGKKALEHVRGGPSKAVECEAEALRNLVINCHSEGKKQFNLIGMIKSEKYRLYLLIVMIANIGQQFSGINAVFYYSTLIFRSVDLSVAASQGASIGAASMNWVMSIVAIPLIRYTRRRTLFLCSAIMCIGCHAILMASLALIPTVSFAPYISIGALLSYVLSYNLGIGPIPFMIATELFPIGPRSVGLSVGSTSNWGSNLIVGLTFPLLQDALGEYSFVFFVASLGLLLIFIYKFLPETLEKEDLPPSGSLSSV